MIEDFALVGLTWMFIIGFIVFAAVVTSDNNGVRDKGIEESILNRNEEI